MDGTSGSRSSRRSLPIPVGRGTSGGARRSVDAPDRGEAEEDRRVAEDDQAVDGERGLNADAVGDEARFQCADRRQAPERRIEGQDPAAVRLGYLGLNK